MFDSIVIPGRNAFLCLDDDCQHVGNCSQHCAKCAGANVWPLLAFLDRRPAVGDEWNEQERRIA